MSSANDKSKKRAKPNYLYAVISVASVLLLVGFFGLIILYAQRVVQLYKERVNVLVELKEGVDEASRERLAGYLGEMPYFKAGSLTYVSKAEAAEQMRETFGEDFLRLDMPNPFYDVVTFNVRASYMQADSLSAIREALRGLEAVNDVFYQENLVTKVGGNIRKIGYIALATALFFIFVAVTLIHYTVRLALYANRFLIKNMELVGASWEFISRPYLYRAIQHGALSGAIASGVLLLLTVWIQRNLPELQTLNIQTGMGLLAMILIVLGILINTWSTYIVVKKYLTMRVDDMY
jgi:cell division transport system permease protein